MNNKTKKKVIGGGIITVTLLFFIANYHIVIGAGLIKRPYLGFSDIIADADVCITAPYIIVMSEHPSLCRGLQNAGYLESDEDRSKRIEDDISSSIRDATNCVSKCDIYSSNYADCISKCY